MNCFLNVTFTTALQDLKHCSWERWYFLWVTHHLFVGCKPWGVVFNYVVCPWANGLYFGPLPTSLSSNRILLGIVCVLSFNMNKKVIMNIISVSALCKCNSFVFLRSLLRMALLTVMSWHRLRRRLQKKLPSPKEWSNLAGLRGCWWVACKSPDFFLLECLLS